MSKTGNLVSYFGLYNTVVIHYIVHTLVWYEGATLIYKLRPMVTITFNLYYLELHSFYYYECIKQIIILLLSYSCPKPNLR